MRPRLLSSTLRRVRRDALLALLLACASAMFLCGSHACVESGARGRVLTRAEDVPDSPVAIIFGARVYPDGQLCPVLEERVRAGVALYRAGKVRKLLMTGDNSRRSYDEVSAMKAYAVSQGVPPEDVVRDFAGFRTFDSCYRARSVFGVRRAVLVTQAYHLPRALYLARRLGIDAVGFAAKNGVERNVLAQYQAREWPADAEAVLDLHVWHKKPRFAGPPEPLFADSRADR